MAWNDYKPRGVRKESKPGAGGAVTRGLPVFGIVKDNIDPMRVGRMQVYLLDGSSRSPDDRDSWVTVNYMSPFYGLTQGNAPNTGWGSYEANPSSYGMWVPAPDIGTTVVCIFINGDPNFGFWIGCVPEPEALHMVPAIGSAEDVTLNPAEARSYGGASRAPVTNINNANEAIANTADYLTAAKPVHSYQASILNQQGLIRDPIRGTIGSNAQRETPSRVTGISTPGRPVYEGGYTDENILDSIDENPDLDPTKLKVVTRRGGHTLVMDDGDIIGRDQLIRLRSAMGHQILMSDDAQTVFIIHSNGQSWIELGKEGTIDMYATNSVNIRTQGDLNLHADRDINMYSGRNIQAAAQMEMKLNTEAGFELRSASKAELYSDGNFTVKSNASMSYASKGQAGFKSSATTFINGLPIMLNTGSCSVKPTEPKYIPFVVHPDTLWDGGKGFLAAPGKLLSIVTRAPAHHPWSMAGLGVDLNVNLTASSVLPVPPSPAVTDVWQDVPATPENPISSAAVATANPGTAVSDSIDRGTTGALLTTVAMNAQNGPAALATRTGAATINSSDGVRSIAVGQFGLSPSLMTDVLKPGADRLVNSLVQRGAGVTQAIPSVLMTGASGIKDLRQYVSDVGAQSNTMVKNLRVSQRALTNAGVITGREAPSAISGIVLAGATAGVRATTAVLQGAANSAINRVTNSITRSVGGNPIAQAVTRAAVGAVGNAVSQGVNTALRAVSSNVLGGLKSSLSNPLQAISAGNLAGNLGSVVQGGIGAITSNLSGLASNITSGISGLATSLSGGLSSLVSGGIGGVLSGGLGSIAGLVGGLFGGGGPSASTIARARLNPSLVGSSSAAYTSIVTSLPELTPGVPQNLREISNNATVAAQSEPNSQIADQLGNIARNTANSAVRGVAYGVTNALTNVATRAVSESLRGARSGSSGIAGTITNAAVGAATNSINTLITTGARTALNSVLNSAGVLGGSASGVNVLPGGRGSIAYINNRTASSSASGAAIPGTDILTSAINNVTRSVAGAAVNAASGVLSSSMNRITNNINSSISRAVGGGVVGNAVAAGLTGAIRGASNQLIRQATNSLAQFALAGLPKLASSQLTSALGSLGSGSVNVKLPKAASGTTDIANQQSKLNSLMSPRVPKPNFNGNPATIGTSEATERVRRVDEWAAQIRAKRQELVEVRAEVDDARAAWREASSSLTQGDPSITQLKQELDNLILAVKLLEEEIATLERSVPG